MIQPTTGNTTLPKESQAVTTAADATGESGNKGNVDNLLQEFSSILDKIASKLSANHPEVSFAPEALAQVAQKIRDRREERAKAPETEAPEKEEKPLHSYPHVEEVETEVDETEEVDEKTQEVAEETQEVTEETLEVAEETEEATQEEEVALDETEAEKPVEEGQAQVVPQEGEPATQVVAEATEAAVQQQATQQPEQQAAKTTVKAETEQPVEQEAPQQQPKQTATEQTKVTTQQEENPVEQVKTATKKQVPEEVARFDAQILNQQTNGAQETGEGEGNGILQRIVQLLMEREAKPELTAEQNQAQQQATVSRDAMTAALIMRQALDVTTNIKGLEQTMQNNSVQQAGSSQQNNTGGDTKSGETERSTTTKRRQTLTRSQTARTLEKVESVLKEMARSRDGKSISLRLDPPSLGNVRVDVTFRDGILHARVAADSPAVNQLLREKAHELQRSLREMGLSADTVSVSVGSESETNARNNADDNRKSSWNEDRSLEENLLWGMERGQEQSSGQNVIKPVVEDHWVA